VGKGVGSRNLKKKRVGSFMYRRQEKTMQEVRSQKHSLQNIPFYFAIKKC